MSKGLRCLIGLMLSNLNIFFTMIFDPKWKEANVNVTIFKKSKMFGSINQTQAVFVLSVKKIILTANPKPYPYPHMLKCSSISRVISISISTSTSTSVSICHVRLTKLN